MKSLSRLYSAVVFLKVCTWLSCSGLCGSCSFRSCGCRFICRMIFCCSMKIWRRIRPCIIFCRIPSRGLTPSRIILSCLELVIGVSSSLNWLILIIGPSSVRSDCRLTSSYSCPNLIFIKGILITVCVIIKINALRIKITEFQVLIIKKRMFYSQAVGIGKLKWCKLHHATLINQNWLVSIMIS